MLLLLLLGGTISSSLLLLFVESVLHHVRAYVGWCKCVCVRVCSASCICVICAAQRVCL